MIQANELRIGNWYKPCSSDYAIITEILSDRVYAKYTDSIFNTTYEYISPIPLTPEILDKCGFKKWGRDDMPRTLSYELGEMTIFPSNTFCDFDGYGFIHYKLSKFENNKDESARFKFQYLHQLQNLYFALTGEELPITL